jgi:N-acetylneuraminic acid mutarotase
MYLFGGSNSMTNNSSFFSLDLTSFKWSVINQLAADGIEDNLPQALDEHSAIVHDGKMYIFGGFVNGERDNQIFYFDFTTSRWSRINLSDDDAKPCARAGHTTLL